MRRRILRILQPVTGEEYCAPGEILFSSNDRPPCASPVPIGGAGAHCNASALPELKISLRLCIQVIWHNRNGGCHSGGGRAQKSVIINIKMISPEQKNLFRRKSPKVGEGGRNYRLKNLCRMVISLPRGAFFTGGFVGCGFSSSISSSSGSSVWIGDTCFRSGVRVSAGTCCFFS